jgi:hypothetical protein
MRSRFGPVVILSIVGGDLVSLAGLTVTILVDLSGLKRS